MATFLYDDPDWPRFRWHGEALLEPLADARYLQGKLFGQISAIGFPLSVELDALTQEIRMSSAIEGEQLDLAQVRSSVARRLGVDIGAAAPMDRHVDGVVEMVLDATQQYEKPLTAERLFGWHASLFPTGWSGLRQIQVGRWRDDRRGPMRVVSGPIGHEWVHFEAPAAGRVPAEMERFLAWFEQPAIREGDEPSTMGGVLRAAISHLWFVTIHPFDDGNGRIARAITEMALSRSERSSHRFYSMSRQIRAERDAYYAVLEQTQSATMDITVWLTWFLCALNRALVTAEEQLDSALRKAQFWRSLAEQPLNLRQREMLNRLLEGFEGKLTSAKWAKISKCSPDTALRDINDLVESGILVREPAGGRSTSYRLAGV